MYNSSGLEWRKWTIPANENYTYSYDTAVTLRAFSDVTPDKISEVSVEIYVRYAPQQCNELVFYVSAGNGDGESNPRAIRGTIQTGNLRNECTIYFPALLIIRWQIIL